jgi:hypothetical protein
MEGILQSSATTLIPFKRFRKGILHDYWQNQHAYSRNLHGYCQNRTLLNSKTFLLCAVKKIFLFTNTLTNI